uniref:Uncharacterized protein n=1 Tax=Anguilla anguilla TaxID=7936 RepID=A0A0E9TVR7_ANGAN
MTEDFKELSGVRSWVCSLTSSVDDG